MCSEGTNARLGLRRGRRGRSYHGGKGGGGKAAGEQNPAAAGAGGGRGGGGGGSGRGGRGRAPPPGSNGSRGPSPAGGESLFVCVGDRGERTVEVRTGGPWYVKDPRGAKLGPYSEAEIVAWFSSLQAAEGTGPWRDLRTVLIPPALGGGAPRAKAPKGKEREAEKDKPKEKDKAKEKEKPNEMEKEKDKDKDKPKEKEKHSAVAPSRGGSTGEKGGAGARVEKPAVAASEKPSKPAAEAGKGPCLPAEADAPESMGKLSEKPRSVVEEPKSSSRPGAPAAASATATTAAPDAPQVKTEKAPTPSIAAADKEPMPALPAKAAAAPAAATAAVAEKSAEKPQLSNDQPAAADPAAKPGSNGVAEPPVATATKAPTDQELSERLFRGMYHSKSGGEPLWRYVDNHGKVQGPFSAQQMILWDDSNFFQKSLLMLGCAPNLAPPNLPPTSSYRPFGELLREVRTTWGRQSSPTADS